MNLTVIAPAVGPLPVTLPVVACDEASYFRLIDEIQRFRGRIYAADEAIPEGALDAFGRHYSELDYRSWHLVARTETGQICGIIRILVYPAGVDAAALQLNHLLDRMEPRLQYEYRHAIGSFVRAAARNYPLLCEPGGWAVDHGSMNSLTGTNLAASVWGVLPWLDNAAAIATATVRHKAAPLLKFMGGFNPLEHSPNARFYDWFHGCEMELVCFTCDHLNPKFAPVVADVRRLIAQTGVLACQSVVTSRQSLGMTNYE